LPVCVIVRDLELKRPQIMFLVDPFNLEMDSLKAPLVLQNETCFKRRDHLVIENYLISNGLRL